MPGPKEENSGTWFKRAIEEMYGIEWAEPSPTEPARGNNGSAGAHDMGGSRGRDDHGRSPEREARDAGFESHEEYEDYLEDIKEG